MSQQGAGTGETVQVERLTGLRRTIARRMVAAWEVPAFHLAVDVRMEAAAARARAAGCTVTDVLVHDCARALREHPDLNASFVDDGILRHEEVGVAIAVATDGGLMAPVIHDADRLDQAEIAARRAEVVERARGLALTPEDVYGGTFTISNLGMFGIQRFDAILNVPQVAILAVGAAAPRLALEDGQPVERLVAELTLTCDHRATDGAAGARFLGTLRERLERS